MAPLPPDHSSPKITVELYGTWGRSDPPKFYEATIDTGFTGGVCIPIGQALPLGLTLHSTANFTLADGSIDNAFLCIGNARINNEERSMLFVLSRGNDLLVGTQFLAQFQAKLELDYKSMEFSITERPGPVNP